MAFPDAQGVPLARLVLERVNWQPHLDYAGQPMRSGEFRDPPRTAAWLACNPSVASAELDDPTNGRVVHHSTRAGCPRSLIGNCWPMRTPYPADLWAAIAQGEIPAAMMVANLEALAMIGGQSDVHVAAYGAEPGRRFPAVVRASLDAFTLGGRYPLYCLGTTDDNQPLHPLARGKFAVRNDAELRPFRY